MGAQLASQLSKYEEAWPHEQELRAQEAEADDLPRVQIETTKGTIVVELFENQAPNTVANFISLVKKGFYDGTPFHRVLAGFMAQGGDPQGDGTGGPGYHIACECYREDRRLHFRGSLSMAHAGRDTGGSQFFITFRPTPHLDGRHTVFGRVIEGMDVLAKITRRDPEQPRQPEPDRIVKATVLRDMRQPRQPETLEPAQ
ncbi:MAG: peptidylprolyl isomerase [Pirellulales bacterium]|nr:peptidylprolyl isomerase [Pirellulales bacterium]